MIEAKEYAVTCIAGTKREIEVEVPGSKSITNRALLLAALADGTSTLHGALFSDDSRHFIKGLSDLGFEVEADEEKKTVRVKGLAGRLPEKTGKVYVGSAGTAARFMTAMLAFAGGTYELDASEQMRKRPMKPLLDALSGLGVQVTYQGKEGFFPFVLESHGIQGGEISIDVGVSSQFLSALLMAGTMLPNGLRIHLTGERKALPYVEMTAKLMEQFGVHVRREWVSKSGSSTEGSETAEENETAGGSETAGKKQKLSGDLEQIWIVPGREKSKKDDRKSIYRAGEYAIEPDVSGACYFYAMALLLGTSVRVRGVHLDSLQGDKKFLQVLEKLGCQVEETPEGVRVTGTKMDVDADVHYPGISVNMNDFSDQTMTMAVVAAFADTPTRIEGVGHIRFQESNRIAAVQNELEALGIRCEELPDGLEIHPGTITPGRIQTYDDHRMAMAFALIGLRVPGIIIENPGCCAKTFENYFELLEEICRAE